MNPSRDRQSDIAIQLADRLAKDPDNGVRLEAATGLGTVGSPAQENALLNAITGQGGDNPIRTAAWNSLNKLLPQFSDQELATLEGTFKGSPDKQLAVDLVREAKYKK